MTRKCELTGKKPIKGNNVSHANNKTKRRFLPSIKKVSFKSEALKKNIKFNVSNSALRTVDKKGGLDFFLIGADDTVLSKNALKIKKDIENLSNPENK